ncbi:MAG: hypothetical protein RBS24_00630 [Bacilli bacterium]|nr:hypothetical protein [Bacilli bacterium]
MTKEKNEWLYRFYFKLAIDQKLNNDKLKKLIDDFISKTSQNLEAKGYFNLKFINRYQKSLKFSFECNSNSNSIFYDTEILLETILVEKDYHYTFFDMINLSLHTDKSKFVNSQYIYFKTLSDINKDLIRICNYQHTTIFENAIILVNIVNDLFQIIPLSAHDKYGLKIIEDEAILLFDEINIKDKIKSLVDDNYDALIDLKYMRNKNQHMMHEIKNNSAMGGSDLPEFEFQILDNHITIKVNNLIKIVHELNIIFNDITKHLKEIYSTYKYQSLYLENLISIDFLNYNKVYDSNDLQYFSLTFKEI